MPLVKYFFFPGFTPRTGGLLRERDLLARREAFRGDPDAQRAFWRWVGLPPAAAEELRISLFAYRNRAAAGLFAAWAGGERAVTCVVPEGVLVDEIAGFFGACPAVGATATRRNLRLVVIPFLRQADYDALLWACDVNFVRGEDSFVRAQWAARPLVWHIYPQEDDAHCPKLRAFLERYCAGMSGSAAAAVRALFDGWNGGGDPAAAWAAAQTALPDWTKHAQGWAATLGARPDLVTALAEAAKNEL